MTENALRMETSSEEETLALGRAFGVALLRAASSWTDMPQSVTVLLSGDLGTGKTTLVRGIGGALGARRVRSPSFTLVNEYHTENFSILHADLYRLEQGGADDLGLNLELEEYCGLPSVLLVEWPERWANPPERHVLKVFIESVSENERVFGISSLGGTADLVLQYLREAVKDGKFNSGAGLQPALD